MKTYVLAAAVAVLCTGCSTTGGPATTITDEAEQIKVKVDKRLVTKCEPIKAKLTDGEEHSVVAWSDTVLKQASECRKDQNALVDWVRKTFKIEEK